jgi:hypothetical protein
MTESQIQKVDVPSKYITEFYLDDGGIFFAKILDIMYFDKNHATIYGTSSINRINNFHIYHEDIYFLVDNYIEYKNGCTYDIENLNIRTEQYNYKYTHTIPIVIIKNMNLDSDLRSLKMKKIYGKLRKN